MESGQETGESMERRLRWGILGTGNIARQFARALEFAQKGQQRAVGSRHPNTAESFAAAHGIPRYYGSYDALLADADVEAVYVSLPNSMHREWTIRALRAGKHVLCEKPIAVNRAQAMEMFKVARETGRVLAEGFMYRVHPLTSAWLDEIRQGAIGQVRLIRTSFCYCTRRQEGNARFQPEMAGGALMDVGCYCVHLSRLVAGAEPVAMTVGSVVSAAGVDELVSGTLTFPNGLLANFTCGMTLHADNSAMICGSNGYLEVPIPWKAPVADAKFTVSSSVPPLMDAGAHSGPAPLPGSSPRRIVTVDSPAPVLALEADSFAATVFDGRPPVISDADSLGNMAVLDELRRLAGAGDPTRIQ
jgi:D-xylose 1-dehydrogenase (NADP+, D-xylono-1,5-lactone-forming)